MTNKNDNRWWHIEEYISGRKALCIGRRVRLLWYSLDDNKTKFSFKAFKSVDMYYAHIVVMWRVLEFHYYRRGEAIGNITHTSLEQSKKLIELGIDVNTADICWSIDIPDLPTLLAYPITDCDNWENKIPAWSLSALLKLMPKNESLTIDLCLGGSNGIDHTFDWFCTCDENDEPYGYKTFHTNNPIDCTFEMIVWLKENNKI